MEERQGEHTKILSLKDLSILDNVRKLFFETTRLGLSFYYAGSESYDFYPQNEKNSYCQFIQSCLGIEPCMKSDLDALGRSCRSGEYCLYTCHAGLLNVVVPLSFKGEILGAMFTGQMVPEPHSKQAFSHMVEKLPLTSEQREELYAKYVHVNHIEKDKLLLAIKLIVFMSNYIISTENEFYLQSEIFKKEERILQFENERMRMRNNLQNLSIMVLKDQVSHQGDETRTSYRKNRKVSIVHRAEEMIQQHYAQALTLEEVAEAVYLSPNYFSSIFKEVTQTTFSNYINEIRIEKAKKLLIETDMPIKEIVPLVGFEEYNYFNRVFKQIAGLPPGSFREMYRT